MAEYIERGALIEKINREKRLLNSAFPKRKLCVGDVLDCIFTAPTADVVEVVRCKDCKHSHFVKSCSKYECKKGCGTLKYSNDFCSYGEAKMDGKGEGE